MEANSGLHTFNDNNGTRPDITKTKIIAGIPNKIFTNIQHVHEDIGDNAELIRVKTKQNVTTTEGRATGGD